MLRQMFWTPDLNKIETRLKLEEFCITGKRLHIPKMDVSEYYKKIVKRKKNASQQHKI